jgi:hypothetical protein
MGQEIASSQFKKRDFAEFGVRLRAETELLGKWFSEGRVFIEGDVGGFELEAWLVDNEYLPAPINEAYLEQLSSPLVVPELATFNVELNTPEQALHGAVLEHMHLALAQIWDECQRGAAPFNARLVMIGVLPTVNQRDLNLERMSRRVRYRALNEQVLRLRNGHPLALDIEGRERLRMVHHDVMLESAATSFQIHLQVSRHNAKRFFNAALLISAPMVAACANSPFLFGYDLWDETRIPLFEQAVAVASRRHDSPPRVTFGSGYVQDSLFEYFVENLTRFPMLLPMCMEEALTQLSHLRLHNGTIWRWNRPLIGLGPNGEPHLRIEHRVVSAGPSVVDCIANAALFFGLVYTLGTLPQPPETQLPFEIARDNFYAAARNGLRAELIWLNGRRVRVRELLLEQLLPMARHGLESLDLDPEDIDRYLGIMEVRVRKESNGTSWQRAFVARHGRDMATLTAAYLAHQQSGLPVHEWDTAC